MVGMQTHGLETMSLEFDSLGLVAGSKHPLSASLANDTNGLVDGA